MEEKKPIKFKCDETTHEDVSPQLENDIYSIMHRFRVEIVEQQDEMIIQAIRKIGGKRFKQITIDKHKVVEALGKSVKQPVLNEEYWWRCPNCKKYAVNKAMPALVPPGLISTILFNNYCPNCGHALDWDDALKKEDKDG
jgi:predicted RNA-binding Zn-ribbon protein involved in translation (DUF1610 family)